MKLAALLFIISNSLFAQSMEFLPFEPMKPMKPFEFRDFSHLKNGTNCECFATNDKVNLEVHQVKKSASQSQIQTTVIETFSSARVCNVKLEELTNCDYKFPAKDQ